jgi:hypothetical protein
MCSGPTLDRTRHIFVSDQVKSCHKINLSTPLSVALVNGLSRPVHSKSQVPRAVASEETSQSQGAQNAYRLEGRHADQLSTLIA